ncbi:hypothetical protein CPB86DRAFT_102197 [Serendipita vermifera]|nr:hypothetical protein CPB86DRAFT_102197 [Serendipita vermifera]
MGEHALPYLDTAPTYSTNIGSAMSSHGSSPSNVTSSSTNKSFGRLRLPNEILMTIVRFVHGKKELYTLCLTNRLLRETATPILYLHYFANSQLAKTRNVDVLFEHPQFGHIVNTLSIRLSYMICKSHGLADPSSQSQCSCSALDEKLGGRHQYFGNLKTRMLQRLSFDCHCSVEKETEVIRMLGSPCMNSVTSLHLRFLPSRSGSSNYPESFFLDTSVLPNLQEVHYHGSELDDSLVRHRPMRRLRASLFCNNNSLLRGGSLWKGNSSLTHLNLSYFGIDTLIEIIQQEPNPLRNLRHMGTFYFPTSKNVSLNFHIFTSSSYLAT